MVRTPSRRSCPTSSSSSRTRACASGDVNIGNVTKIEVQDWHALVTMRINGDVHLPANSTAKVGQTSLLGAMHIELAPPVDQAARGGAEGRFGDTAVGGQHLPHHRADAGVGVSPAQRRRHSASSRRSTRPSPKALAGSRERHAQPADPAGHLHRPAQRRRPTTSSPPPRSLELAGRGRSRRSDQTVDKAPAPTIPQALAVLADSRDQAGGRHRRTRQVQRHRRRRRSIRPRNRSSPICATSRPCSASWPMPALR